MYGPSIGTEINDLAFCVISPNSATSGTNYVKLVEVRPTLSATEDLVFGNM